MSKAIWCLCVLLILHWIIQWRLTQWKVSEIKAATEHIDKKIDEVATDIDQVVQQYMKDPEAWNRIKQYDRLRVEGTTTESD